MPDSFDDVKPDSHLRGLDPSGVAEIVQVSQFGPDAVNVVFRADARGKAGGEGSAHQRAERRGPGAKARRPVVAAPERTGSRAALILPMGLLRALAPRPSEPPPSGFCEDAASRAEIEWLAMDSVMAAERTLGNAPRDVSADNTGWDIESRDSRPDHLSFIEVKGRAEGGEVVMLTKNEMLAALKAAEAFILAIVRIEAGFARQPVYVRRFFDRQLTFAENAVAFTIADLVRTGAEPA